MKSKELSPIEKGRIGEKYIARYLRRNGYRIIERNMRNMISEIDIIAVNKEYIVFVEVKTRTVGQPFPAISAVNAEKRRKIKAAAHSYINYKRFTKKPRFDVAEVYISKEKCKVVEMNYHKGAF